MLRCLFGAAWGVLGGSHDSRRVPQDRRRPKMTDHILAILSARDGHGRWSGPDQDHARRSTCLSGHCTALAWPGDAVVAAVMAPVEGKNAKMTKSLSGARTAPGAFSRLLYRNSYVKKFDFFSELLRAHAAPGAAWRGVCPPTLSGNRRFYDIAIPKKPPTLSGSLLAGSRS